MSRPPADGGGRLSWPVTDAAAWDAFVEGADHRAFPQLWSWGELRAGAGWQPLRLAVGTRLGEPEAGVQLLVRRLPLTGWGLAYAPRGPVGALDQPAVRGALWAGLRQLAATERIGRIRVDPEVTADEPLGAALLAAPWRPAPRVQPPTTRLIDLTAPEEALWSDLARKHRQYVSKAEREGVSIEALDPAADAATTRAALADFDRIYRYTGQRAGFAVRVAAYYQRVWHTFAGQGRARLSFAVIDGERVACLFHLACGDRVAEVYGGMTDRGAERRASYLLKWEAIRALRAEGLRTYDLWGLATGGIRRFKAGFGGTEVTWVGARDLGLSRAGDAVIGAALAGHGLRQRLAGRWASGGRPRQPESAAD